MFLYDILKIFTETTKLLHGLYHEINEIHPTLKFTMIHTSIVGEPIKDKCYCEFPRSIPFLDTSLSIKDRLIDI